MCVWRVKEVLTGVMKSFTHMTDGSLTSFSKS